jgi:hypothetical protein
LDQQAVEVPPCLMCGFPNQVSEERRAMDDDLLKVLGFDGLEGHGDPLDVWSSAPKLDTFEFGGLGEVKQRHLRRVYTHQR